MADEAKEKEEKKPKAETAEPKAKEAEAPAGPKHEKHKKINRLSLSEIETELKNIKEKMGGFQSRHAQELLLRKKELTTK